MMLIAGTVPVQDLPLTFGQLSSQDGYLFVNGKQIPCLQGTGAVLGASLATTEYLGLEAPYALVAADFGEGKGSREIYQYLIDNVVRLAPKVLALHYWLPNMNLTRELCRVLEKCRQRPVMIADAASMYSAKAAGLAREFDIFTPDATEMAFLADPEATHPAYIARHFFDTDITKTPELARSAYEHNSTARFLLVKGSIDHIIKDGEVLDTVTEPDVPALEAIGGTGDTITGLVAAFAFAEMQLYQAAIIAAKANRVAGQMANVTPASGVSELVTYLPAVFQEHLCQWSDICTI